MIDKRFELRGTLGAGGAGTVYRAFDRTLGREVALKQLRTASGRDLFRFKREFRSLADLAHPNLVALYELHAVDSDWFFTMELVEGDSFIDRVRPPLAPAAAPRPRHDIVTAQLDVPRLRAALVQLADALTALHAGGKLHRDLKPSNVIVEAGGRVALVDFGLVAHLAALADRAEPERLAVGTPAYMSPEQAGDRPLDEASDWYAVGAMLYEALTGHRPFEGTSAQIMTRKQTELPVAPTQLAPDAPPDLAALALALLRPEPAARPRGLAVLAMLGATPSAASEAVAREANRRAPAIFVGREREIDALRGALADARRRVVCVLVRGRSGLGKSTLVHQFLAQLPRDAAIVLAGRCFEREAVPFKMLDGVVDSLTAELLALPAALATAATPRDVGSLVRLFPVLRRVPHLVDAAAREPEPEAAADPQEIRRRGFQALRQLIGKLARARPVIVFVDDGHWGDADSAVVLAELVHGADPLPGVLVVVAHRPEDYLGVIAQLRRAPGGGARRGDVRELDVAALSDADATRLVTQISGSLGRFATRASSTDIAALDDSASARGIDGAADPTGAAQARETASAAQAREAADAVVAAVVAASAGNPLVLSELARLPLASPADAAGLTVADLVRERVIALPPEAQAMLAVSSIAARPIPIAIAAYAAGIVGGHDVANRLSAERLATLRGVGDAMILHPAHDFVRAAVLAGLDASGKAAWHEALARAFEAVQGKDQLDSQAVVEHWLAAGHPANAAEHALAAAARAEKALAFIRAAELYRIALDFGPWDAAGQRDLLRSQGDALSCAGQLDEAAAIYAHAAELLPDGEAIDLDRLRVEQLLRRGRLDEALPAAERLLAQVGMKIALDGRRASRTRLATQWMQMKLRGDRFTRREPAQIPAAELLAVDVLYSVASGLAFADPALGRVVQAELVRAALDAGEPFRVCLALAQEVFYTAAGGTKNRVAVEGVGRRLAALADELDHPHAQGVAHIAIGLAAHLAGRWQDARAELEAGLETLRAYGTGVRWELDIGESYWLATLGYLGDWREMARLVESHLRDAIDRGDAVAQQHLRTGRTNLAWLVRGRPDEATEQLATATRTLGQAFSVQHARAALTGAQIALYRGDASDAARILADAAPAMDKLGWMRFQLPRIELGLLRVRIALADDGAPIVERLADLRAQLALLDREGAAWLAGLVTLYRACSYLLEGADELAEAGFGIAEEQLAHAGMDGFAIIARLRHNEVSGGAIGVARAAAARDAMIERGVVDPERFAQLLVPVPSA